MDSKDVVMPEPVHCERCGFIFVPNRFGKVGRYGKYCSTCRKKVDKERVRAWAKEKRAKKTEQGLCHECDQTSLPGKKYCEKHYAEYRQRIKKCKQNLIEERRKLRLCTCCGESAVEGRTKCQKHLDYYAALYRRKTGAKPKAVRSMPSEPYALPEEENLRAQGEKHSTEIPPGFQLLQFPLGEFLVEMRSPKSDPEEFVPTQANPGSEEKMLILAERAAKGLPLFHPDDLQVRAEFGMDWLLCEEFQGS